MKNLDLKMIVRTVLLALAFINAGLTLFGYNPIPIDEEAITNFITLGFLGITTVLGWYLNNNVTKQAQWAQIKLNKYKAQNKMAQATGQAPIDTTKRNNDLEGNL